MADERAPEICVIGGGPGGIALAVAAASQGLPVVLIEKGRLGGANLREGGIPSKALLAAAGLHEALRRGPAIGVTGAPLQVNFAKVQRSHPLGRRGGRPERLGRAARRARRHASSAPRPASSTAGRWSPARRRSAPGASSSPPAPCRRRRASPASTTSSTSTVDGRLRPVRQAGPPPRPRRRARAPRTGAGLSTASASTRRVIDERAGARRRGSRTGRRRPRPAARRRHPRPRRRRGSPASPGGSGGIRVTVAEDGERGRRRRLAPPRRHRPHAQRRRARPRRRRHRLRSVRHHRRPAPPHHQQARLRHRRRRRRAGARQPRRVPGRRVVRAILCRLPVAATPRAACRSVTFTDPALARVGLSEAEARRAAQEPSASSAFPSSRTTWRRPSARPPA